jgi:poly(hydroxyalkanoate) depolymerase family esterase
MTINSQMQDGMAEAARLTQEGRLAEATAVIQRVLGGSPLGSGFAPAAAPDGPSGAHEPIDVESHVVNEAQHVAAASQPAAGRGPAAATRPVSDPPLLFRGVPLLPDGLPLSMLDSLPSTIPGSLPIVPDIMPKPTEGESDPAVVPTGGQFIERSYTNRAGTRAYKLYIPNGYVGQEAALVVMLHGCTQTPDDLAAGTRMNALAEEHTFLVAYPAQAQGANMSKCWNWFEAADQQRGRGEPSIIAGITREIVEEYHVDHGRVYVAGMSAGGAMAAIMGEAYPDLYAAIGIHSGLAPGAAHDLPSAFAAMHNGGPATQHQDIPTVVTAGESARIVPTIVFHGDRDTTVHPRNADHLLAHYRAAKTAVDRDAASGPRPRGTVRRGQVPGGHAYTRATYRDADGRACAEQWTIHGLGHAWSGGSSPSSYTDPKGPDASAEMVRFFNQHPRREPIGLAAD